MKNKIGCPKCGCIESNQYVKENKLECRKCGFKWNLKIEKEVSEIMSDWVENHDKIELLEVIWEDARTLSGTSGYQEIKENGLLTARTIGYLVYEDEKRIAICGFLFPDENCSLGDPKQNTAFREVHNIPKGWIKVVKVLNTDWTETNKFKDSHKDWFGLK